MIKHLLPAADLFQAFFCHAAAASCSVFTNVPLLWAIILSNYCKSDPKWIQHLTGIFILSFWQMSEQSWATFLSLSLSLKFYTCTLCLKIVDLRCFLTGNTKGNTIYRIHRKAHFAIFSEFTTCWRLWSTPVVVSSQIAPFSSTF